MGMALSYVHAVYVTSAREWTADQGMLNPEPPGASPKEVVRPYD